MRHDRLGIEHVLEGRGGGEPSLHRLLDAEDEEEEEERGEELKKRRSFAPP